MLVQTVDCSGVMQTILLSTGARRKPGSVIGPKCTITTLAELRFSHIHHTNTLRGFSLRYSPHFANSPGHVFNFIPLK